ncbi:hypothetical protein [Micromonospora sp. NPDC048830]|uniref:hypothetical protein n=1 Tax=Micromonospora sp. NPDC048830 TaxID=3364257 RepID=UPI00371AC1EE
MTVDKTRQAWTLSDIEIVLDLVVDAGDFVEFEFKGDTADVRDATPGRVHRRPWYQARPVDQQGLLAHPYRPRPLIAYCFATSGDVRAVPVGSTS